MGILFRILRPSFITSRYSSLFPTVETKLRKGETAKDRNCHPDVQIDDVDGEENAVKHPIRSEWQRKTTIEESFSVIFKFDLMLNSSLANGCRSSKLWRM